MRTRTIVIVVIILAVLWLLMRKKQVVAAPASPVASKNAELTTISNTPVPTVFETMPGGVGTGGITILPLIVQPQTQPYPIQYQPSMVKTIM